MDGATQTEAGSEDLGELGKQILIGQIKKVPESLNLTEKGMMFAFLIENAVDIIPERIILLGDRVLSRIFHDERWDLARVLDE